MSVAGARWMPVASAARIFGTTAPALRKALDAGATLGADGVVEAEANGIRGRKQGGTWRVLFAPSGDKKVGADPANDVGPPESTQVRVPSRSGDVVVRLAPLTPDQVESVAQRLAVLLLRRG